MDDSSSAVAVTAASIRVFMSVAFWNGVAAAPAHSAKAAAAAAVVAVFMVGCRVLPVGAGGGA